MCKAKKIEVPNLKYLPKTGATAMEKIYGWNYACLYLANSPDGIAARHYVKPDQGKFDAALASLGAEYGII